MKTRTGNFPIGVRQLWMDWHKDVDALIEWSKEVGLEVIDLGKNGDETVQKVVGAGLRVGSVDFAEWQGMISADKAKRADAVAKNTDYVRTCTENGPQNFFLAMLPENSDLPRMENFGYMVESFSELASVLEKTKSHVVIEGWPGPGALCCTPADLRAFFEAVPSETMGINYDPSHLIRMSIDPLRFLEEFKNRVFHVHGKDCTLLTENLYNFGSEQPPTFAEPVAFGAMHWRYAIPGHGVTRWTRVFEMLEANGYEGAVSIELEDANFTGDEASEKQGILRGAQFLSGC